MGKHWGQKKVHKVLYCIGELMDIDGFWIKFSNSYNKTETDLRI